MSMCLEMDTEWQDTFAVHQANVIRLNVAELRVLLIHYRFASTASEARTWSRADMVEAIAEQLTQEEIS